MARNGSGVYSAPTNNWNPPVAGQEMDATDWQETLDDIEVALSASIASDGQTTTSARIPFATGVSAMLGATTGVGYSFTSDPNTGFYSPAADKVGIVAGGTEQLRIESALVAPIANNTVDLGSTTNRFKDGYFAGNITGTLTTAAQTNITSVGTLTGGTWNANVIGAQYGGTGRASHTAYAVVCGGTTSTSAQQSVASVGTSGHVLTSNGAGALPSFQALPTASGGWVPIKTVTASASATVDFVNGSAGVVLDSTYKAYAVVISVLRPATDGSDLYIRTSSNGGVSFDTGGSDYNYAATGLNSNGTNINGQGNNTYAFVCGFLGNDTGESTSAVIYFFSPSSTLKFQFSGQTAFTNALGYTSTNSFVGSRLAIADVDAIRFLMSSGNITSGTFTLYGLKDA
ncbi:hypothetical protein UFOVP353_55 [uncultured Caudovirales phage]|uniref:Uncharacterized protein n=1 Tax=uncultured Caudovirales phage TaxID=2100421 RepID=A0A6J5LZ61_9CAUD|nr:hypothetical protein UFOVP353_55 [uncultured Caudovirales phage]